MKVLIIDEAEMISAQWRSTVDMPGCPANPAGPLYPSGPYAAAELRSDQRTETFGQNSTTVVAWWGCCD
jgi:hypothetical protein